MSDLVHLDPAAIIEQAADPAVFVITACERAKSWLTEALDHGDLDAIKEAKGWAETLRVATMQKQLGTDSVLAATELVRRAERCIGVGIRQGQEAGVIRRQSDNRHTAGDPNERGHCETSIAKRPVTDFVPKGELSGGSNGANIYAITDDVSDEQFEEALVEAKAERDLSRANVVRKIRGEQSPPKKKPGPRPSIDSQRRYFDNAWGSLVQICTNAHHLDLPDDLGAEEAAQLLTELRGCVTGINKLRDRLKEITS